MPRDTQVPVLLEVAQPAVQFYPLRICHRHNLWVEAVLDVRKQREPFLSGQVFDVDVGTRALIFPHHAAPCNLRLVTARLPPVVGAGESAWPILWFTGGSFAPSAATA